MREIGKIELHFAIILFRYLCTPTKKSKFSALTETTRNIMSNSNKSVRNHMYRLQTYRFNNEMKRMREKSFMDKWTKKSLILNPN